MTIPTAEQLEKARELCREAWSNHEKTKSGLDTELVILISQALCEQQEASDGEIASWKKLHETNELCISNQHAENISLRAEKVHNDRLFAKSVVVSTDEYAENVKLRAEAKALKAELEILRDDPMKNRMSELFHDRRVADEKVEGLKEALEFYADGIFPGDESEIERNGLKGLYCGRRAQAGIEVTVLKNENAALRAELSLRLGASAFDDFMRNGKAAIDAAYEITALQILRDANAKKINNQYTELKVLREALESIIAMSHSWIITEDTAYILKPVHDSYRKRAREALGSGGVNAGT